MPSFWKFDRGINPPYPLPPVSPQAEAGKRSAHYDLPLNNPAIMVKWKCLEFLYLSKGMCRIDSQLKKLTRWKYLILETPYTFFLYIQLVF